MKDFLFIPIMLIGYPILWALSKVFPEGGILLFPIAYWTAVGIWIVLIVGLVFGGMKLLGG